MEKINAVIEDASLHDIYDLFNKKPKQLKFNDTDAIVVKMRAENGERITKTFYFCLKPNGTFERETISRDGSRTRRHRLASFIKYYGIADNVEKYNIRERIDEWRGKNVELLLGKKEVDIYIP